MASDGMSIAYIVGHLCLDISLRLIARELYSFFVELQEIFRIK